MAGAKAPPVSGGPTSPADRTSHDGRVRSWNQLVELTFADSYSPQLQRFRSPFAFRGMCADWPLLSSLQRLRHAPAQLGQIEKAMFRNFKKYAYSELEASASNWKWLAVAQHHGLPTRLLDWTFSPFVAMHFATNELDKMDKDGVLWMVNFAEARTQLPPIFQSALHQHFALTFSVEMLEEQEQSLADPFVLDQISGARDPFILFFEPPSLDPRIVNQWGLFSITNRLDVRMDHWLLARAAAAPSFARKIVIAAEAKWEIRDKLDGMNLTERVLMPGLDGLSTWLKRWYSPKIPHPTTETPGPATATVNAPAPIATAPDPPVSTAGAAAKSPARKKARKERGKAPKRGR